MLLRRIPDPAPDLKKQVAAALAAELTGWRCDYAGAWLGADYSAASKIRNGDLRRFSLQRLLRMAAALGIEARLTLTRPEDIPRRTGGNQDQQARRAAAWRAALARDAAHAPGVRLTLILDEGILRRAHACSGLLDVTDLIHAGLHRIGSP